MTGDESPAVGEGPGHGAGPGSPGGRAEETLGAETACVVGLSAALGDGGGASLEEALAEASRRVAAGEARQEAVEEALLQAHLFVGYPATLGALARWRELGHPAPAGRAAEPDERRERGERLCRAVYGKNYDKLRRNVRRLHPDMDRWMVEEGYGRVLGRPGLGLVARELCVVALLARTGHGPQLHSHLRGALGVGASPQQVEAALRIAAGGEAPDRALPEGWALWLRARGGARGGSGDGAHGGSS